MDRILIFRDTIMANVVKVVDSSQPFVQETESNWADVEIIKYICLTVVASILLILIFVGIVIWNYNRNNNKENNDLQKILSKMEELRPNLDELTKKMKENVDNIKIINKEKSSSEKACELLDKISSLAKPKEGITDEVKAEKLFSLYQKIKKNFNE
jgi:predicted nuclease with TOPRIM domain